MGIKRHFIGWEKPFVLAFSECLLAEAGDAARSLDEWLIWVPSSRAGRHILNELFTGVEGMEAFHPPRLVTPAQFVASLGKGKNVASDSQRLYAWKSVLSNAGPGGLKALFPVVPKENRLDWAYSIAEQLILLQERLLEENSSFTAVADSGLETDLERWSCLAGLESAYHQELERLNLVDPGTLVAGDRMGECLQGLPYKRLLVAGILNLSQRQQTCLDWLRESGLEVDFYIPAPAEKSDGFDTLGRPATAVWPNEPLPDGLLSGRIHRAGEPRELTSKVLELAEVYQENVDALVVGSPEEEIADYLIERSRLTESPFYAPQGTPLKSTAWGRLIGLVFDCRKETTLEGIQELIRHALFRKWAIETGIKVSRVEESITRLRKRHLVLSVNSLADPTFGPVADMGLLKEFLNAAAPVLGAPMAGESLPEHVWRVVQTVAGCSVLTEDQLQALSQLEELLQDLNAEFKQMELGQADQWAILVQQMGTVQYYPERGASERPVAGWLELPWETAPHLVLLGLPDNKVPGNDKSDPLLTPALCRQAGFYGPDEAAAFHAFRLRLILESRKTWGKVDLLLPDRGMGDDPAMPCRFLFLADPESVQGRVVRLLEDRPVDESPLPARFGCSLSLPEAEPMTGMSVTGFKSYLRNPFAFYLEYRLGWEAPQRYPIEMDALMFGNLAHDVLEELNSSDAGCSLINRDDIVDFLQDTTGRRAGEVFGGRLTVPLQIQVESMRERMRAAAEVIASERGKGWLPAKVEWAFHREKELKINGVQLRGKIDLLERNEESGQYRIVDYKTSDKNDGPEKTHLMRVNAGSASPFFEESDFVNGDKAYRWKDLQLPLYQLATKEILGIEAACAYICLGKATRDIHLEEWTPSREQQEAAYKCASAIIGRISAGDYPLPEKISPYDPWMAWFNNDFGGNLHPDWLRKHVEVKA